MTPHKKDGQNQPAAVFGGDFMLGKHVQTQSN